jgi:hypothetical protein
MIYDSRDEKSPQMILPARELISDEKALRVILRLTDGASHPKTVLNPTKYQIVESRRWIFFLACKMKR